MKRSEMIQLMVEKLSKELPQEYPIVFRNEQDIRKLYKLVSRLALITCEEAGMRPSCRYEIVVEANNPEKYSLSVPGLEPWEPEDETK